MPTYLDVGVVRVQSYLARWPSLRGRRGASAMIIDATARSAVEPLLSGETQLNPSAGQVDGVVSLEVANDEVAERTAGVVLASLRAALPAAEFEAVWGAGPTYLDAYRHEIKPRRQSGDVVWGIPAASDLPLAHPCDLCAIGSAETRLRDAEGTERMVCVDCARRDEAAGRRTDQRAASRDAAGLTAEQDIAASLRADQLVTDFGALAKLGPDRKANHLATVFIDGNRVGDLFDAVARAGDEQAKAALSGEMVEATRTALREATETVWDAEGPLSVIPHLQGGDDVLVSVPAAMAWRFVRHYLTAYERSVSAAAEWLGIGIDPPTASAGVVVAHANYPFGTCVDLAERVLTQAKMDGRGRVSNVRWTDITREGHLGAGASRRAWSVAELSSSWDDLAALAGLPRSTRSSLDAAADHDDPDIGAAQSRRLVERLDIGPARPFLDGQPDATHLRSALDMVRWWS